MGRANAVRGELGKIVMVYLGDGSDAVSGTLVRVTDDDMYIDIYDDLGEDTGMRHLIPWDTVYRVVTIDPDAPPPVVDDDAPEPPEWVSELIMKWAAEEAAKKGEDDGTVPGQQPGYAESGEGPPEEGERTPEEGKGLPGEGQTQRPS